MSLAHAPPSWSAAGPVPEPRARRRTADLLRQARDRVEAGLDGAVGQALADLLQLGGDVVGDVGVVERGVGDATVLRRQAEDAAGEAAVERRRRSA